MKEQENKDLDSFLRIAVKDIELDQVSSNFNAKLFERIRQTEKKTLQFKPLIETRIWWVLALVIGGLLSLGYILKPTNDFWLFPLKYNTIGNMDWLNFSIKGVQWNSTMYGMVGLVVFILFQVLILKKYFSNRKVII